MRTYHLKQKQSPTLNFNTDERIDVRDGRGNIVERWTVTRGTHKDEGQHYFNAQIDEYRVRQ